MTEQDVRGVLEALPAIVGSMAVLEEWLENENEGTKRKLVVMRRRVHLELCEGAVTTRSYHSGSTLSDSLAQAAQVALSNPNLEPH